MPIHSNNFVTFKIGQAAWNKSKLKLKIKKVKHANVTTIYKDNKNTKCLQKYLEWQGERCGCKD